MNTQPNYKEIESYMRSIVHHYTDSITGEVNATELAEDAADHYSLYEPNDNPKDELFDIAAMIAIELEG